MPPRKMVVAGDPLHAQGYRTQRAELPEDLWQPLYDRVNYPAAGTGQLAFFSTPKGQSATLITLATAASKVKSYRDTNLENANVVPTKLFKFVGLSLAFVHASPTLASANIDRIRIRDGSYLNFRIVDKDILFLPTITVPELNPMVAAATTTAATDILAQAGGGGANVPMYKFPIPITLNPYESFQVTLNFDGTVTVTTTLDIYLILHGFMRRPT